MFGDSYIDIKMRLYLSSKIIMSCGGTLRGLSRADVEGSTFEIEIPNKYSEESRSVVNVSEIKLDPEEDDPRIER